MKLSSISFLGLGEKPLDFSSSNDQQLIDSFQAVNILRTAPYVCTMLIESCVASPATPNGKPAMPGSQSTSAFYSPNRHPQMQQPVMQRQSSFESQYSSMHQQFVPSQSQQIEDIVSVSTLSIEKRKSDTSLPLDKHSSSDTIVWGRPVDVNPAAVSAQIRQRALRKRMMISKSTSLDKGGSQTSMEESKDSGAVDSVVVSPKTTESIPRNKGSLSSFPFFGSSCRDETIAASSKDDKPCTGRVQTGNFHGQEFLSKDQNLVISQGKNISDLDEQSTVLGFQEQRVPDSTDESNVGGFFRKIQSLLFSPSIAFSNSKNPEESESSCGESDLDSELSEITSGSFNAGEIESMREELESLLLKDSSKKRSGVCRQSSIGETSKATVLPGQLSDLEATKETHFEKGKIERGEPSNGNVLVGMQSGIEVKENSNFENSEKESEELSGEPSGENVNASQGKQLDNEVKEKTSFEKGKKETTESSSRFSFIRALSFLGKNNKLSETEADGNEKLLPQDAVKKLSEKPGTVDVEDTEDKKQLIEDQDSETHCNVDESFVQSSPMDDDVKQGEHLDREENESSIGAQTKSQKETSL